MHDIRVRQIIAGTAHDAVVVVVVVDMLVVVGLASEFAGSLNGPIINGRRVIVF